MPSFNTDLKNERNRKILEELDITTGVSFEGLANRYRVEHSAALSAVVSSDAYAQLGSMWTDLEGLYHSGRIRGIDTWAGGEGSFRFVPKSYDSVLDKIYRINIIENPDSSDGVPPKWRVNATLNGEQALAENNQCWVTPENYFDALDDVIRTKFVVPFMDSVVKVSGDIEKMFDALGVPNYKRYHAKDSGYHARHVYGLISLPEAKGMPSRVVVEVKILTKLQDTLGELTHALYESQRGGDSLPRKKRSIAWEPDRPEFWVTYTSHAAQLVEAEIVKIRDVLEGRQEENNAES